MSNFLQIHTLTSYSGVLLNRDDVGFAKRLPFGGAVRTRVSSQCLKRHWRQFRGDGSLAECVPDEGMSIRSRRTFDEFVFGPLVSGGVPEAVARAVTDELRNEVLGAGRKEKEGPARSDDDDGAGRAGPTHTGQVTVLGHPEMRFLLEVARKLAADCGTSPKQVKAAMKALGREGLANLRAIRLGAGLDAAMFGRMVTGDVLARCDAAIHVAHAFTVHGEASENDYFAAVDDLVVAAGEDLGSGHIGTTELTSGLFYGYVVVDVPTLVSNLESCAPANWRTADRTLAAEVVRRLVRLVATVTPGAKLGSTAPYAYASFVGLESGTSQPRTLANAFLQPVRSDPDLLGGAYRAIASHVAGIDAMYGCDGERRFSAMEPVAPIGGTFGARCDMDGLADWAAGRVRA